MKTVRQLMRVDLVTLPRDASVAAAMRTMLEHRVGALPVVEGQRILGIITARDLLGQALYRLVGDVMTTDLAVIGPDEPVTAAYQLLEARHVNQLPVVEHGRLIGMVTRLEVLHELGKLTDPLTGLPWPGTLRQRAAELLAQRREIVVIFIDLDRFRLINKRFGHVAGDRLISAVASALLRATDTTQDLLCRYGGDEFALVTTRPAAEAEALAERLLAAIRELTLPELEGVSLTASVGLAGGRRSGEREAHPGATVDDLITMASRASTAAKSLERPLLHAHEMEAMAVLQQAVVEEGTRLRIGPLGLTVEGGQASARVELELEGRRYSGVASGPAAGGGPLRAMAQATTAALAQLLPPGWTAEVEEITYTPFPVGAAVSVALVLATPTGEELLVGTVPYARNDTRVVVRAVLKAVNRRLVRLLALAGTR
ncbi:MAG: GGDEF domain-containing protein [Armatimonadota bacterium]|nr:GGDEF domain-containing protein [Armatimonadota bacterium]MDR7464901.1 GGDEF domain-containing protein [Armatimonadota bacterium]MDR7471127.1 GGDEF domain-containing protein [Armatimonadota bacterium]MDR7474148.1 GGDEF domain-containing protein [Armatimonadota bacterium]MDR7539395.1 GGDEF domain-containing protein [Armatimonadota bacterium]